MSHRWHRRDDGVTAVMVAVLAVLLFSMAALAVDLSNALTRKRDVQTQADFAALAGGVDLPNTGMSPQATDPSVIAAADYLEKNQPQNDADVYRTAAELTGDLTDGLIDNGEVLYGTLADATTSGAIATPWSNVGYTHYLPSTDTLTVISPQAQVDFGLAGVMDFSNTKVRADASVAIRSPGESMMPVYAVAGCDFGPQTITDPAGGATLPYVPLISHNAESNGADINDPTDLPPGLQPDQVPVNTVGQVLTLSGSGFRAGGGDSTGVTEVGFFQEGSPAPEPIVVTIPESTDATTVSVTIPTTVTGIEGVWWVRVWRDPSGASPAQWSDIDTAAPLRVGEPFLECDAGSSDGNFGTLKLPRTDQTPSDWLPVNMADSLQDGLTLAIYPGAPPPDICTTEPRPPAVVSPSAPVDLNEGTNCVDTDTGLPANAATDGLIKGAGGHLGKLDEDTTAGCRPDTSDARLDTGIDRNPGSGNYTINNDVLTCFFTDGATTVAQVLSPTYTGDAVISKEIFESPRFIWVPVLGVEPTSGGSGLYSIVDFRPAFITDQPVTATRDNGQYGTAGNGLTFSPSGVTQIKVNFFNVLALPRTMDGGPSIPYIGVGPKLIRLVN